MAEVAYDTTASGSDTTAVAAFAARRGVCQDHGHIFIAAARSLEIPARYVTGYLLTDGGDSVAHHAWAEALVPEIGWVGFDAANGQCPTERYVRLAVGLDAIEAAPVRGGAAGGGERAAYGERGGGGAEPEPAGAAAAVAGFAGSGGKRRRMTSIRAIDGRAANIATL